jgi:hypothetical protein
MAPVGRKKIIITGEKIWYEYDNVRCDNLLKEIVTEVLNLD